MVYSSMAPTLSQQNTRGHILNENYLWAYLLTYALFLILVSMFDKIWYFQRSVYVWLTAVLSLRQRSADLELNLISVGTMKLFYGVWHVILFSSITMALNTIHIQDRSSSTSFIHFFLLYSNSINLFEKNDNNIIKYI